MQPAACIAGLTRIGNRTYIAMKAAVVDRVTIGEGCVVAAGAVVTTDLPARCMATGVPAQVIQTEIEPK